uniref:Uncharacterized protein n=1 Tax=Sinocyclocheilus grahami TaxID=75366 RepID=A0A672K7E5_SINGR
MWCVSDVPLLIYFHGGYWQFLRSDPHRLNTAFVLHKGKSKVFCIIFDPSGVNIVRKQLSFNQRLIDLSSVSFSGAFLVSGIYDLQPILSTYVNEPLKMTENSPSHFLPQLKRSSTSCDIIVAVAQNDSPEFRKQSEEYFK